MDRVIHPIKLVLILALALAAGGCISTGETIRIQGEVVDVEGNRITDAVVIAEASKRGGTIVRPGEWADPDSKDESRQATVDSPGDGTFTATSRWAGTLTLTVEGYKIRRVDDLGTVFLVPSRSFFKAEDQVRLEVVKDE